MTTVDWLFMLKILTKWNSLDWLFCVRIVCGKELMVFWKYVDFEECNSRRLDESILKIFCYLYSEATLNRTRESVKEYATQDRE